jgi:DNA polymerase-3 subunit gamma/tau
MVARVAGANSSLLQISSDERERAARVAAQFSEEDLTRHLQIMLRTHNELGYRQEQRFHLELGLLKMVHAQRLLPLEELLSGAALNSGALQAARKPSVVPEAIRRPEPPPPRAPQVSPFAADSARKGNPKAEFSENAAASGLSASGPANPGPRLVAGANNPAPSVVMGAAAPAAVMETALAPEIADPNPVATVPAANIDVNKVRNIVLEALANTGQRMLASMLEIGEWNLESNELMIKVAASAAVIDMSLGPEAKRLVIAKATEVTGRAMRLRIVPGAAPSPAAVTRAATSGNGGRGRVEQDPVVRRMKEKFGAEIRTVIDYQNRDYKK